MINEKENVIVIMSGGLDSTVLAADLATKYNVYGLSFYYGQRHKKELYYAIKNAKKYCKEHKIISINFVKKILSTSNAALLNKNINIPHEHYTHENQKQTVVHNRNMLMLTIASIYANTKNAKKIFYGAHKNDYAIYKDCRVEFVSALNNALKQSLDYEVEIIAPFINMYKKDIVLLGSKLNVNFKDTWSCYEGKRYHCGKCGTCQERIEAFKLANIPDPTKYK